MKRSTKMAPRSFVPRTVSVVGVVGVVGLVGLAGSGCIDPTIPDGASITCEGDDECPDGFACQGSRGICVPDGAIDETAPKLSGDATISPEAGGTGTVFTLAFEVDETLAEDPSVTVDIGGVQAAFAIDDEASDVGARRYVYHYTASGAETPDRASPVSISLVDVAANPSPSLSGGIITFDFSPPAFVGAPTLSAQLLGPGDVFTVSFETTEVLADGGATLALVQENVDGEPARLALDPDAAGFAYTVVGDEVDGEYALEAVLTDRSGNAATVRAGRVIVDVTAPTVQVGATVRAIPDREDRGDSLIDVRADSTIEVVFLSSEALAESPRVFARCGEASAAVDADLTRVGDVTSQVVFVARLEGMGGLSEGTCALLADLTDPAGNTNSAAVVIEPAFRLDQTTPAAPAVDVADAVVYRRIPWGSDETDGAKRFDVTGLPNAVEGFAQVAFYETVDAPADQAIARTFADGNGSFAVVLAPVDRAELFISQFDTAGNEGPRARIRDVRWTATMGGKVAGSSFVNPHRYESRAILTDNLIQGAVVELGSETAIVDGRVGTTNGAGTWENVTESIAHPDIELANLAYDPARGKLYAFGGISCSCGAGGGLAGCPDTFERRGAHWVNTEINDPEGDGNPDGQGGGDMVFDADRGVSVLVGQGGAGDIWELNGSSWRKACRGDCALNGPPAALGLTAAYDPIRRRVVVFGGAVANTPTNETWEWDGAQWEQRCLDTTCTPPPPRADHTMAWDPSRNAVVIFAGRGTGNVPRNDLWAFDGETWNELCVDGACAATKPTPRLDTSMVFDVTSQSMLIYGGVNVFGVNFGTRICNEETFDLEGRLDDTLRFDDAGFQTLPVADPEGDGFPGERSRHQLVWDPRREKVVLVGGVVQEPCATLECFHDSADDTWEWDGTSWRRFADVPQPTDIFDLSAAYDASSRDEVMVVGGGNLFRFGERWRSSGSFTNVGAGLATSNTGAVVFGGRASNSNTGSSFTGVAGNGNFATFRCTNIICLPLPAGRFGNAMAQGPNGNVVSFGGESSNTRFDDTFELTTAGWVARCTGCTSNSTKPSPTTQAAMVFDPVRNETILFGGLGDAGPFPLDDLWSWNGTIWRKIEATGPEGRRQATFTFDDERGRAILFGGARDGFFGLNCGGGLTGCRDLWEWDGSAWREPAIVDVELDGDPGIRTGHGMAYSPRLSRSVMFGGGSSETWLYNSGATARPGQVMAVAFAAAGTAGDETIIDVEVDIVAGGAGDGEGPGAEIRIWDLDGWRSLISNTASADAPALLAWRNSETPIADDPQQLRRLFFGAEDTLFVATTTAQVNGDRDGLGVLGTDSAEVTVAYRLPATR